MIIAPIFDISVFNKDIFVFLGGCAFMMHLIHIASQTRSTSFTGFVNYLFVFSALYLLTLAMLAVYLKIGFSLPLGKLAVDVMKEGFALVKTIFTQLSP